jgi:tRNA pseudouridine38-40 synthase
VRNIVGTLLEVGVGKRAPDDISKILDSKDRRLAGPTAPAHGLYLMHVSY